ncbi:hypothetical protein PHLCEN_2v11116 [Hermanssonia centrifuga]|uniref:BHLH domain-containing protein n=1 Tax=Hermanssonia centrifuga TaxID=98765 RepID=A0A2R6NLW9_9APHY|nr:hypothetical protein PHLCEN_2v11116 [Hermanssonia centrifuga]
MATESTSPRSPQVATQQPIASGSAPLSAPNGAQNLSMPDGIGSEQVLAILKQLPHFYRTGDPKDAAETLSNMSQAAAGYPPLQPNGVPMYYQAMEPGPSTHPRGPPALGNMPQMPSGMAPAPPPTSARMHTDGNDSQHAGSDGQQGEDSGDGGEKGSTPKGTSRRNGRNQTMSNDEWTRQRKDNHKEVERRRRGNINEGINELGRIVPNGSGEKAKGAILSRAVQYIHHLKENEARNIEKWTLEKLLMDQAMGDLQAQLEEMRRLWDDERMARQRAESELEVLRGLQSNAEGHTSAPLSTSAPVSEQRPSPKRPIDDVEGGGNQPSAGNGEAPQQTEERAKRQRVE